MLLLSAFLAFGAANAAVTGQYTISVGALGPWGKPDDTPAASYIDKDGTYYFQQAHALYGATDQRRWTFYSGKDMDSATVADITFAKNPSEPRDSNADTTWRCNNSPTGKISTYANGSKSYAQANYCDLAGVWVDPDSGDWYGLVHNEFTPQPFGDGLHYDGIDAVVSSDQGRTWTFTGRIVISPYSTVRGDTSAFPQQTYHYGDGDPRLVVDIASGYFYMYYGSRIVNKGGSWVAFHQHVARSPMKDKFAVGSWQKWYDGQWAQPGVGGKESNIVPVSTYATGYTPSAKEYNPNTPGKAAAQIAAGTLPPTSPLFVMDVTWNAYLGLWIGEPQAVNQSGNASQEFYATDDLTTQKWTLIGNTGSYTTASWYRWLLDPVSRTSSQIVGRDFRAYCSFGCSGGRSSEYVNIAIEGPKFSPVDTSKVYYIQTGSRALSLSGSEATSSPTYQITWTFESTGDGAYTITSSGKRLGVAGRQWGSALTATTATSGTAPTAQEQWWAIPITSTGSKRSRRSSEPTFRLVNRYSGLVLALPGGQTKAETTPARSWDSTAGGVGGGRTVAEQVLMLVVAK